MAIHWGGTVALLACVAVISSSTAWFMATKQNQWTTEVKLQHLDFGNATRMVLNVGAHNTPPLPWGDPTVAIVAVEPLPEVAALIPVVKDLYVLAAAVSTSAGLTMFNHYQDSSSLLEPERKTDGWLGKGRKGTRVLVPVIRMDSLLTMSDMQCWFVKTDMQGMDFMAVQSAGKALQRCGWLLSETYCNGFTYYSSARNDYDAHWLAHMTGLGFVAQNQPCGNGYIGEMNVLWKNIGLSLEPVPADKCPRCFE